MRPCRSDHLRGSLVLKVFFLSCAFGQLCVCLASLGSLLINNMIYNAFRRCSTAGCSFWLMESYTRLTTVFSGVGVLLRCLWPLGCCSHREPTGEIPVRSGGVREEPVPEPAQPLWEAPSASALSAHRLLIGN